MPLPADQLVALLHGHHLLDLGPGREGFEGVMRAFVADGPNDRSFHPPDDVRFVTELADLGEDSVFFFLRDVWLQDYDHNLMARAPTLGSNEKPQA